MHTARINTYLKELIDTDSMNLKTELSPQGEYYYIPVREEI